MGHAYIESTGSAAVVDQSRTNLLDGFEAHARSNQNHSWQVAIALQFQTSTAVVRHWEECTIQVERNDMNWMFQWLLGCHSAIVLRSRHSSANLVRQYWLDSNPNSMFQIEEATSEFKLVCRIWNSSNMGWRCMRTYSSKIGVK